MLRLLRQLFLRPAVRDDPWAVRRIERGRTLNPQFVTFLRESERRSRRAVVEASSFRRRQVIATALVWLAVLAFGWIVLESAQALSVF